MELHFANCDLASCPKGGPRRRPLPSDDAPTLLRQFPKTAMDALRIATSLLALYDPDEGDER